MKKKKKKTKQNKRSKTQRKRKRHLSKPHLNVCLGSASAFFSSRFLLFFFFFWLAFVDFGRQYLLLWTVYTLFTHCAYTVHILKNIKNGFHDTIYTFKNYFATVFSVFSFQFSATISSIQTHPKVAFGIQFFFLSNLFLLLFNLFFTTIH